MQEEYAEEQVLRCHDLQTTSLDKEPVASDEILFWLLGCGLDDTPAAWKLYNWTFKLDLSVILEAAVCSLKARSYESQTRPPNSQISP